MDDIPQDNTSVKSSVNIEDDDDLVPYDLSDNLEDLQKGIKNFLFLILFSFNFLVQRPKHLRQLLEYLSVPDDDPHKVEYTQNALLHAPNIIKQANNLEIQEVTFSPEKQRKNHLPN